MKEQELGKSLSMDKKPEDKAISFVVIESPFLGGLHVAVNYARLAVLDSLMRGEVPLASHLLYPQCLDDHDARSRMMGMTAGWAPYKLKIAKCYVYTDLGMSKGVHQGVAFAKGCQILPGYRSFGSRVARMLSSTESDSPARLAEIHKEVGEAAFACEWP